MVTGLNGSTINPKKLFMKIKKKYCGCRHPQHKLTSIEYYCGCRHPQYNFILISCLVFLIKSATYN